MAAAVQLPRQGLTDAAVDAYRKVLKIDNTIAPAHDNLALMLKNQGKTPAANKAFKSALKCDPGYALAYALAYTLAYVLLCVFRAREGADGRQFSTKAAQPQEHPVATLQELDNRNASGTC